MKTEIVASRISPKEADEERVTLMEKIVEDSWELKLYYYGFSARFWQESKSDIWSEE